MKRFFLLFYFLLNILRMMPSLASTCTIFNPNNNNTMTLILVPTIINRNDVTTDRMRVISREFTSVPDGGFVQILKTIGFHGYNKKVEISYFSDYGQRKRFISKNSIDHAKNPLASLEVLLTSQSKIKKSLICKANLPK